MDAIITLTTDLGDKDAYVSAMKWVILGINPKATLVDICHSIEPQQVAQGAFVLSTAYRYFPAGTIHLVVIDPGVGSQRRAIILVTPSAFFVAPDNGVLSYIIEEAYESTDSFAIGDRELPPGLQAIALSNPQFWLSPVSATFHGRDIFAPVAAHLSRGIPAHELGEVIRSIVTFPISRPQIKPGGTLLSHVIHIDRFGNLITDVRANDLPKESLHIEVAGCRIEELSTSYVEGGDLVAIVGSSGYLEIAARGSSAAKLLGAKIGDEIRITGLQGNRQR